MKTPMKTLKTMLMLSLIAVAAAIAAPLSAAAPRPRRRRRPRPRGRDLAREDQRPRHPQRRRLLLRGPRPGRPAAAPPRRPGQQRHVRAAPPVLAQGRQLIAVDLQGHGRSSLGSRPIRCEAIADDVAALLKRLGRAKVDVLGYSFGGCVALRLAMQHPERRAPPGAGVDAVRDRRLVSGDARRSRRRSRRRCRR